MPPSTPRVHAHRAIRLGQLIPQACWSCGSAVVEAYVVDAAARPVAVEWLCHRCLLARRRGDLQPGLEVRLQQRSLDLLRKVAQIQQECRAIGVAVQPVELPVGLWPLAMEADYELFPNLPLRTR